MTLSPRVLAAPAPNMALFAFLLNSPWEFRCSAGLPGAVEGGSGGLVHLRVNCTGDS